MQEFSTKFALYASMLSSLLAAGKTAGLTALRTYLRFMHLLANSALLLTLVNCAFLQYTQKPKANVPFHTLHLLSGTTFLQLSKTQDSALSFKFALKLTCLSFTQLTNRCVCV